MGPAFVELHHDFLSIRVVFRALEARTKLTARAHLYWAASAPLPAADAVAFVALAAKNIVKAGKRKSETCIVLKQAWAESKHCKWK